MVIYPHVHIPPGVLGQIPEPCVKQQLYLVVRARNIPSLVPARPWAKPHVCHLTFPAWKEGHQSVSHRYDEKCQGNAKQTPWVSWGIQIPAGSNKPWELFKYLKWKGEERKQLQEVIPALSRCLSIELCWWQSSLSSHHLPSVASLPSSQGTCCLLQIEFVTAC